MTRVGSSTVGVSTCLLQTSSTLLVPRNPLRLIVSRSSHFEDFYQDGTQHLAYFLDTLECGHQQFVYNFDVTAGRKRHRCGECPKVQANILAFPKKPSASLPGQKKEAA